MVSVYEEKQFLTDGNKGSSNPMTSLLRPSADAINGSNPSRLTGLEMYGNIFLISFAGHDTRSNPLAFGLASIATRPDIQD